MVSRPRVRSVITALCLYVLASLMIGYFGVNAYTGKRGLNARKNLEAQMAELTAELTAAKAERAQWQQRVALLQSDRLDPDLVDERARALLNYVDRRDIVVIMPPR